MSYFHAFFCFDPPHDHSPDASPTDFHPPGPGTARRARLPVNSLKAATPHLYLNVAHFGARPQDRSPHHGGEDVLGEVGAGKATLDELGTEGPETETWENVLTDTDIFYNVFLVRIISIHKAVPAFSLNPALGLICIQETGFLFVLLYSKAFTRLPIYLSGHQRDCNSITS